MSQHLLRAELLIEQGMYERALAELQQQLRDDPQDAYALARQSLCLAELGRLPEAITQAQAAIGWAPDAAYAHFALARARTAQKKYAEAMRAVDEAIALEPHEVVYFGLKSVIHLQRYEWAEALTAADQGLAIDPEHAGCLNSRIFALTKLGRKAEAAMTAENALARNPMVAETHASHGWTLLQNGQWAAARTHFLEALRLEPDLEWAQRGLVESIKARNPVYRVLLYYVFLMTRLSPKVQLALVFGGMLGINVLSQISKASPALTLPVTAIIVIYMLAVYFVWVAEPLGNLLLRLHPLGKHALSRDQRHGANLIGMCYLIAAGHVGLAATGMPFGWESVFRWIALVVPASAVFRCAAGKPRWIMAAATAALGCLGIVLPVVTFLTPLANVSEESALGGLVLLGLNNYWLGIGLSTWLANGLLVASRE